MSPTLPGTPASTHDYVSAVAAGFYGLRTDPLPDTLYQAGGGAGTNPPKLTACQPTTGPRAGGTTLNLGGTHLTGVAVVAVGQKPATAVTVVDDTKVTCKTPAGDGQATVEVANASGVSSLAGVFTYTD